MLPSVRRRGSATSPSHPAGPASLSDPEAEPSDVAGHETDAAQEIGARRDGLHDVVRRKVAGRRVVFSRRSNDAGERVFRRCFLSHENRLGRGRRQSSAGFILSSQPDGK